MAKFTILFCSSIVALFIRVEAEYFLKTNPPTKPYEPSPNEVAEDARLFYKVANSYTEDIFKATKTYQRAVQEKLDSIAGRKMDLLEYTEFLQKQTGEYMRDLAKAANDYKNAINHLEIKAYKSSANRPS